MMMVVVVVVVVVVLLVLVVRMMMIDDDDDAPRTKTRDKKELSVVVLGQARKQSRVKRAKRSAVQGGVRYAVCMDRMRMV